MLLSASLSLFELPQEDSGSPARPGRPNRSRPTHVDRLGRSESLAESSESPRVAPSCSTETLRATKVDRKGRPSGPETRFSTISVDFGNDFSGFPRLHCASDSTRSAKGRTSVFAGRRSTFKGSQTSPKKQKSTEIDEKLFRRCFANALHEENSFFSLSDATRHRFG